MPRFAVLQSRPPRYLFVFFFNDTATTEIYTLSLHDALPISEMPMSRRVVITGLGAVTALGLNARETWRRLLRSEEHTSELQSRPHLVCRLLLEKKNRHKKTLTPSRSQPTHNSRTTGSHAPYR